ncbi:MAG: rhodanese-like domain-containing protein [Chromatiaceae bacterium]|jgi:rhodanese-related sulfurtransferase|nr:rhodanese-like domain-containing protein [Chromatiaceae bacterium]
MLPQLIEFITNHWLLFVALVVILALLVHNLAVGGRGSVDPLAATDLINRRDAIVVDVRPAADFAKGHIINATNLPMNGFKNQIGVLQKHKDKPILVNCRSGAQSAAACKELRKEGFAEVYNLRGGLLAWENANLPLTRKKR